MEDSSMVKFINTNTDSIKLLLSLYFNRNFGQSSKSQIDLVMFKLYLDYVEHDNQSLSDYEIAYNLGLTEKRVRFLREKIEYQFGKYDENYLKDVFILQLKNAVFDEHDGMIKILIKDISLMTKIRYKLEKLGLYDVFQRNPKVLQCKPEVFIVLLSSLYDDNSNFSKKHLIGFFEESLKNENNNEQAKCFLEKIINDLKQCEDKIPSNNFFNCIKENLPMIRDFASIAKSFLGIVSFLFK